MNKNEFLDNILITIDSAIDEIINKKTDEQKFLSYQEFKSISENIKRLVGAYCKHIPIEVLSAFLMAEAVIAPSDAEKKVLLMEVQQMHFGIGSGFNTVLNGIGPALKWEAGVILEINLSLNLQKMLPIISGHIPLANSLTAITKHFSFKKPETASEMAVVALKNGILACEEKILNSFQQNSI
jgi:hypothetical protein